MAEKCAARVCAVGSEKDICKLLKTMVMNADEENTGAPEDVQGWLDCIRELTGMEAPAPETVNFFYEMICRDPYGEAEPEDCLLTVKRQDCGLWTALFEISGETPFQAHDWAVLHRASGLVLMSAIYAEDFPDAPSGGLILSGGRPMDDWERMHAAWLWLISRYGTDEDCEEPVQRLLSIAREEAEPEESLFEEWEEDDEEESGDEEDLSPEQELLETISETARFLSETAERTADQNALLLDMRAAADRQDFRTLLDLQLTLADAQLWDTDRAEEWIQALREMAASLK